MQSLENRLPPTFTAPAEHETSPLHQDNESTVAGSSVASIHSVKKNKFKRMTDNVTSNVSQGLKKTASATMGVGEAFAAFINRGSVVDLAIGVVMGAAFTAIVTSFVNDLITPIIGLIGQKNLENLFLVMHCGGNSTICRTGSDHPYATVKEAAADRAATWNYGNFIQAVINFFLIAGCMFFLVQLYSNTFLKMTKKPEAPKTKECEECCEPCPIKAKKCRCCLAPFPEVEIAPAAEAPVVAVFSKMFHKEK